ELRIVQPGNGSANFSRCSSNFLNRISANRRRNFLGHGESSDRVTWIHGSPHRSNFRQSFHSKRGPRKRPARGSRGASPIWAPNHVSEGEPRSGILLVSARITRFHLRELARELFRAA